MNIRIGLLFLFSCLTFLSIGQIVQISPSNATADNQAKLIFDATKGNGELVGASKVYIHHGVITSGPTGEDWQYVIGNWGMDDGVGQMTKVTGETDKWEINMSPTIRNHFNVPASEDIFRISMVFRSADGNTKGTIAAGAFDWGTVASNLDMYFDLDVARFVELTGPTITDILINSGESINITGSASSTATSMAIAVNEGSGFVEKCTSNNTVTIACAYVPTSSGSFPIKVTATIDGEQVEQTKTFNITVQKPNVIAALPNGVVAGINYDPTDDTKVTLVLEAPNKQIAFVVGDMNGWTTSDSYQMNQTADKEYFWLTLDNLTPGQPYVFQYWVDGAIKIGDPYAAIVADPWNDQFIPNDVYPNIPVYDKTEHGIASVLQTAQSEFVWDVSEQTWTRPDLDHLVIYELLIRDFIGTHDWDGLKDTLDYIKNLGVDAIEILPFSEFEGNESWGYNNSYMFATDKYYGTPEDIKEFIQYAHQEGLAVIMDIVLNHAFDQNPMAQLYFDHSSSNPTPDNPWFNQNTVGPFEFGNDFNHESSYTRALVDRVNRYWIEEFHIDGYRFDFTKGFTQNAPSNSLDAYDQSRIDNLTRMADQLWSVDPDAYTIFEHFGTNAEEVELGAYGAKLWSNRSYDYVPAATGNATGAFTDMDRTTHISYFDSHDERRIGEHLLNEGLSNGSYDIKDPVIMYERVKQAAAFTFLIPGPKMLWQFDELGYDIDINFNGRVGNKPLPWGASGLMYYEDPLRQHIYSTYKGILDVRRQIDPIKMKAATVQHQLSGSVRRLSYDTPETDLVVIGNFGMTEGTIDPEFSETGYWYDYFSGDSIQITSTSDIQTLKPGEWHIYTSKRLGPGISDAVATYDNPVTISPIDFTASDEITITFDATKAWLAGTAGLVGASQVYFHSGVVLDGPESKTLSNIVGTLTNDGIGEMTSLGNDLWEIKLTPKEYYNLSNGQYPFRIGMYFRDGDNVNLGKGFRDMDIYFNVASEDAFIQVTPTDFDVDTEITIRFNALKGNRELVGASKVYMHSSMGLVDSEMPYDNAWNNVIGNWGMDDGVGQMTKVSGKMDQWQIILTPKQFYSLAGGDHPYWLACVFRSADGNIKGTGAVGTLPNGLIHTNQDNFIRNERSVGTTQGLTADQEIMIYPNPTSNEVNVQFDNIPAGRAKVEVIDITGRILRAKTMTLQSTAGYIETMSVHDLHSGMYLIRIVGDDYLVLRSFVKQ